MAAANATIAALKVSLGLDSAQFESGLRDASATMQRETKKQAQAAQQLERRIFALKSAIDPAWAEQQKLNASMKEATDLYKMGAINASDYAKRVGQLDEAMANAARGHLGVANAQGIATKSSKVLTQAGLNLSRQFADVGVSLAGGISPMMVLIQQGPQIADAFGQAKSQGMGFGAVLKGLTGSIGPLAVGIAAIGGAAALSFGLFERAIDKSTKNTTTWGQAFKATVNVIGKEIMDGPIGDGLKWLGAAFGKTFDAITDGVFWFVDNMVGHFGAAFQLVVKYWYRLPEVFGVIAQGAANLVIRAVEGLVNKSIDGLNVLLKAAGKSLIGHVDLPEIKLANAAIAADYKKLAGDISSNFKAGREGIFAKIVKETDRLADAQKKGKKDAKDAAREQKVVNEAAKAGAEAYAELTKRVLAFGDGLRKALGGQGLNEFQKVMLELRQGLGDVKQWEDGAISIVGEEARLNAEVTAEWAKAQQAVNAQLEKAPDKIGKIDDVAQTLAETFDDIAGSLSGILRSFKSGDFSRIGQDLGGLFSSLQAALSQGPAGILNAGSAIANAIGGKGGRAIGGALGIAGAGVGFGALAGTGAGAAAIAAGTGLSAAAIGTLATVVPPLAVAAAALYAAAKLFNIGGKPSNKGAGVSLVTGEITGKSRDTETEQAALSAADAIKGFQASFAAAGITLTETVHGLVIGTRDASQIYTTAGRTITAAVGDAGAAVEAGVRAILESAVYASAGQKAVAEKALAAGKSFDQLIEVLGAYESAQKITGNLAEQLQALKDPKAFDIAGVTKDIAAQRQAYAAMVAEGYLTADQLAVINGQLSELEQLRLNEVLKRYVDAVDASASELEQGPGFRSLTGDLQDQIVAMLDPERFDITTVMRDIAAQRDAYGKMAAEGKITAEELAGLNGQLERLQGLRLDEISQRYALPAVNDNTPDLLASAAEMAKGGMLEAYNAFARVKEAEVNQLRQAADGLKAFQRELRFGGAAGKDPQAQLEALRKEFARLSGLGATDPERLANLQGVGAALVEASKAASKDELSFRRDQAAVRRAVEASATAAMTAAEIAQAQLDAETAQLTALGLLTNVTQEMAAALKAYLAAQQNAKAGGVAPAFNAAAYLAANPDLGRNWNSGGSLHSVGKTLEEALLAHYNIAGMGEIAAGGRTRGFATGGQFKVGGPGGIDSQLMKFWASPGEMVSVSHGDPQSGVAAGLAKMDGRLATLERANVTSLGYQRRMEKVFLKWDKDGLPEERDLAVGS